MATFEVYQDKAGRYRWRLRSSNGQITATAGEGFSSKPAAKRAAEAVKASASGADIVEV